MSNFSIKLSGLIVLTFLTVASSSYAMLVNQEDLDRFANTYEAMKASNPSSTVDPFMCLDGETSKRIQAHAEEKGRQKQALCASLIFCCPCVLLKDLLYKLVDLCS